jgi:hypothetical protein
MNVRLLERGNIRKTPQKAAGATYYYTYSVIARACFTDCTYGGVLSLKIFAEYILEFTWSFR